MVLWRGTVEYTPLLTGKRVWEIVEVEAPTLEAAIQQALLKTGIGPIRRQLTHVKVDIGQVYSGAYSPNVKIEYYVEAVDERPGFVETWREFIMASSEEEARKIAKEKHPTATKIKILSFGESLEPIPPTREERLAKVYEIPIQPRAADVMGKLNGVYDKIMEVPDEICWRCRLNIDAHCTAFLLVGVEKDQEYRRGSTALCAYVLQGRIVK